MRHCIDILNTLRNPAFAVRNIVPPNDADKASADALLERAQELAEEIAEAVESNPILAAQKAVELGRVEREVAGETYVSVMILHELAQVEEDDFTRDVIERMAQNL